MNVIESATLPRGRIKCWLCASSACPSTRTYCASDCLETEKPWKLL